VTRLKIAWALLFAGAVPWLVAVAEGVPCETAACSDALSRGALPPQIAVPADSGADNLWSDLRDNLALPGAERPSLPGDLPARSPVTSPGATKVEEGVLLCASVHPPPLV